MILIVKSKVKLLLFEDLRLCRALILFIQILALYKSFTYLLTYNLLTFDFLWSIGTVF